MTKAATGTVSASYDYDPFGQTMMLVGEYASQNPFRFGGQYTDVETGLIYYGYRYYNPQNGRWISRDPSEETGGLNLFSFVGNDATNNTDFLGLWKANDTWSGGWGLYSGSVTANKDCDNLFHLAFLITGYGDDWRILGRPKNVRKGDTISIAPLLKLLEGRLRTRVDVATRSFNSVFDETWQSIPPDSGTISKYFGKDPFGKSDCQEAGVLVYAKAMIDVLGNEQFDKLGITDLRQVAQLTVEMKGSHQPGEMLVGDSGYLQNYPEYVTITRQRSATHTAGAWTGENIIKVGQGRFWGFLGEGATYRNSVRSVDQWKSSLEGAYQRVSGGRPGSAGYPKFSGKISFIDTAYLAQVTFDDRNK